MKKSGMERMRQLRIEADYYGLQELVRMIDDVSVGKKIVLERGGWARVAGGCLVRNNGGGNGDDNMDVQVGNGEQNEEGMEQENNQEEAVGEPNEDGAQPMEDEEENNDDADEEEVEEEEVSFKHY
jgi:cobalamin biosynthesis protein CobT